MEGSSWGPTGSVDVHKNSDPPSWHGGLYFVSIWPYMAVWPWLIQCQLLGRSTRSQYAFQPSLCPLPSQLTIFWLRGEYNMERAPSWLAVGMEYGWKVIHSPIFCDCYYSITRPTLTNISHKVLDSSWAREVCSRGPLVFHDLRLSKASPVLMWGVVSEGQTDLSSWTRTASRGYWPFSSVSSFSPVLAHLQHFLIFLLPVGGEDPPCDLAWA